MERIAALFDLFSIDLILKTLFMPFRQIDAERVNGPLGVRFRSFIDKLVSRLIGAMVRLAVLAAGCISIIGGAVLGAVYLCVWPVVPFLPLVGLALAVADWIPWR